MTEWLSRAVLGILGAAIFGAAARELAGEGRLGSAVRIVSGALLLFALLQPLCSFDWDVYALSLAESRQAAEQAAASGQDSARRLLKSVMEEEYETYICTRAQALGAEAAARVETRWSGEYWYPVSCTVRGKWTDAQKRALADTIGAELGIPEEKQTWERE